MRATEKMPAAKTLSWPLEQQAGVFSPCFGHPEMAELEMKLT
jgi:hypothetical protein